VYSEEATILSFSIKKILFKEMIIKKRQFNLTALMKNHLTKVLLFNYILFRTLRVGFKDARNPGSKEPTQKIKYNLDLKSKRGRESKIKLRQKTSR
jgi:acyl-CoA-binding protein